MRFVLKRTVGPQPTLHDHTNPRLRTGIPIPGRICLEPADKTIAVSLENVFAERTQKSGR